MKKLNFPQITLKSLLENNKIVIGLSIVLAVFFWCTTAIKVSPIEQKSVQDVKIQFDLSIPEQSGLKAFSNIEAETLDVVVEGKKSKLSNATKEIINAKVDCSEVSSSGTYTLPVTVSIVDEYSNDFEIVKTTKNNVRVWFDTVSEGKANIETEISGQSKIPDGYIMGEPALSTDIVTYSGPTQSVNQVAKVVARATLPDGIQEAVTVDPQVIALDENGNEVKNIEFQYGNQSKLSLVIPILKEATLPVGVNFLNTPSEFNESAFQITYSPSKVSLAASTSYLNSTSKLSIGTIDFTELVPGVNTFHFKMSELAVKDVQITEATVENITVTITLNGYQTKLFSVGQSNIQITNVPDGYTATLLTETMENVGVIGPAGTLDSIASGDLYAVVDLTDAESTVDNGTVLMRAKVRLKSHTSCWVIGHYQAHIQLTKN